MQQVRKQAVQEKDKTSAFYVAPPSLNYNFLVPILPVPTLQKSEPE